jgi:perosamine synthetase
MPDREGAIDLPFLPYGKQQIADADIKAVVEALCSGWLTTGPRVSEFEKAFAAYCGAPKAWRSIPARPPCIAPCAPLAWAQGDEVIVPAITFAAVRQCGGL